jgi:hypothetical protein
MEEREERLEKQEKQNVRQEKIEPCLELESGTKMCEKCQVYLYDYFQQSLDKENPLYSFVNHSQIQKKLNQHVNLTYSLLTNKSIPQWKFVEAKSKAENYCSFVKKLETNYQLYDLLYAFLKSEKNVADEMREIEALVLDLSFLKLQKSDKSFRILQKWVAFLLGSLYEDMILLHKQHSCQTKFHLIDLEKGHPGRPDTARKILKKQTQTKVIFVKVDDDDDGLYT